MMDKDWCDGIAINSDAITRRFVASVLESDDHNKRVGCVLLHDRRTDTAINKKNEETTARELPIKMKFPFDVDSSPVFELVLIIQLFHDLSVACVIAMLNALLVTLVSFNLI